MKITALEESANFATIDTEKLFSKIKNLMNCLGKVVLIMMLLSLVKL
jgi:hypothetical protein